MNKGREDFHNSVRRNCDSFKCYYCGANPPHIEDYWIRITQTDIIFSVPEGVRPMPDIRNNIFLNIG